MKNKRKTLTTAAAALAIALILAACSAGAVDNGRTGSGYAFTAAYVSGSGGNTLVFTDETGGYESENTSVSSDGIAARQDAETKEPSPQTDAPETTEASAGNETSEPAEAPAENVNAQTTGTPAENEIPEATGTPAASGDSSASGTASTDSSYIYEPVVNEANVTSSGVLDASGFFTDRDLRQNADLSGAVYYTVTDGKNITVTGAGVYVLTGSAKNVTVTVEAGDGDKVQLVFDGLSVTNTSAPCIYVKSADKVFVTTAEGSANTLTVTGTFTADGDTNTDAVIFSKEDLVLNGLGTLTVKSTDNGITCKDDLKITGGTLNINCTSDALEANDSIRMSGGSVTIVSKKDGLHAEYDEDNSVGFIYVCGGTLNVTSGDDGIHATTCVQIDGGEITVNAGEGIEGTYIQLNGGTVNITASDDGVNAAKKSNISTPVAEINGGSLTIIMGAGDTDAIDSNGNLYINGGYVNITARSPFDYDGTGKYSGGTLIVNGTQTTSLQNQMMGGGGMGPGGNPGGWGGRR